jgi:hypothetical protein
MYEACVHEFLVHKVFMFKIIFIGQCCVYVQLHSVVSLLFCLNMKCEFQSWLLNRSLFTNAENAR